MAAGAGSAAVRLRPLLRAQPGSLPCPDRSPKRARACRSLRPYSTTPSHPPKKNGSPGFFQSTLSRLEAERRLAELGAKWSQYSGYDAIETLKRSVLDQERRLQQARTDLDEAKRAYVNAVSLRSNSQKSINDLLSRKSAWSEDDLSAYTALLRSEHAQTRAETESQSRYEHAERDVQLAFDVLVRTVMRRYHEEQIWSDKVRNASSYATLIVAGLNVLIFTLAIIVVEPYKRKKLAQTFEKRLLEGEAQGRALIQATIDDLDRRTAQTQRELTAELQQGRTAILTALGVAPPSSQQEGGAAEGQTRPVDITLPLAARIRVGLADEHRRAEWAVTSGIGALAGVVGTLALALLLGGRASAPP